MRHWLAITLLLLGLTTDASALLQVRNGGTQFSAEINIGTAMPRVEHTILWRMRYRVDRPNLFQTPFAVGFGHGFDIAQRYIVGFDGSGAVSHNWAIGDDGSDTYGADAPEIGRIYCQAIRRDDLGTGTYKQEFFYDLLTDTTKIARQDTTKNNAWSPSTWIVWGAVPWTDFEGMDGWIENAWIFDTALTVSQMVNQCTSGTLADGTLSGNVFAHWPMVSDGNDTSGNGRHLSLVGGPTEAWFDGTTTLSTSTPNVRSSGGVRASGAVRF